MERIILSQSDKKILASHAEKEKPNESCAVLLGRDCLVSEVFLAKNIEESPAKFTISNGQLIEVYEMAERRQMHVIGIFHSHPGSDAYPSATDRKFMQANPVAWVIYSGVSGEFRAFVPESEIPVEWESRGRCH